MRAILLKRLLSLHRALGGALGVLVLMWALTGVLHPIMSATQPQPAKRMPPPQQLSLASAMPLPAVLRQHNIHTVQEVQAIQLSPSVFAYRVKTTDSPIGQYFDSQTGRLIAQGEQQDAERLAVWYSGKPVTAIQSSQIITTFSDDYPNVNRLLPVWQVQFEDGLRAYVDPSQSRLATLSNDRKMWMARIFRLGHTWTWGQTGWTGQHVLMKIALSATMLLTVLGVFLFFRIRNRHNHRLAKQPTRRFHRRLGLGLSVVIMLWLFSGLYHIWHEDRHIDIPVAQFDLQNLTDQAWSVAVAQPIKRLSLAPIARTASTAQGAWLTQAMGGVGLQGSMTAAKEHDHQANHTPAKQPQFQLVNATTAQVIQPFEQAKQLAAFYTDLPVSQLGEVSWVTAFGGEYGFINKRLPVLKVQTHQEDGLRVYIEPTSGVMASQVNDDDALEGFSFAYLHKWTWLPVPKGVRDSMMAVTAGMIVVLVLLGFRVWWIRRRSFNRQNPTHRVND
jgi:hypothetical protein